MTSILLQIIERLSYILHSKSEGGKGKDKRQPTYRFHLTNDLIAITPGVKCCNTLQLFMTGSENSISNWSYKDNLGRQNAIIQLGI